MGFEVLIREILLATIPVHLDPFLGYLHSVQKYKPSLVYDMMEPFRALIEDFLLSYNTKLGKDSFEKHGDRMFLKQDEEIKIIKSINRLLDTKVPYVRRNYTKTTKIRTVIREEPIRLAQYIRERSPEFAPFSFIVSKVIKGVKVPLESASSSSSALSVAGRP